MQFNKKIVKQNFEKAANTYDKTAVLQSEINKRLLERLTYIRINPQTIVDIGSGTGHSIKALQKTYPKSHIIGLDLALSMLQHTKYPFWQKKPSLICSDMEALPLKADSCSLLFSNVSLQWCNNLLETFKEFQRVIHKEGLLLFSTFGPDTLKELKQSFSKIDNQHHVHSFIDMHDIGDMLIEAGFADPVVDMEYFTLTYDKVMDLLRDLQQIGALNALENRRKTLTGKQKLQQLVEAYEDYRDNDKLPATYEVIYGHAWITQKAKDNTVYIPIKDIGINKL